MMTEAQEYLLDAAVEQHAMADMEIRKLYKEFNEAKVSREVFHTVYESMMHTIGYWEGVKNICGAVIKFMDMGHEEYLNFQREQEIVRLHNERMKEEILKSIKDLDNAEEKQSEA